MLKDEDIPVLKAFFEGTPRDKTALDTGISGGKVSSLWDELKKKIPFAGELRELSVNMKKYKMNLPDAKKGLATCAILDKLGLDKVEKFEAFCNKVYKRAVDVGENPAQFAESALEFSELLTREKKSPSEILAEFREASKELPGLERQLAEKRTKITEAHDEVKTLLEQNKVTKEDLSEYVKAKDYLKTVPGVEVSDIQELAKMLQNAKRHRYNVQKISKLIDDSELLTDKVARLRNEVSELQGDKKTLNQALERLERRIEEIKGIKDAIIALQRDSKKAITDISEEEQKKIGEFNLALEENTKEIKTAVESAGKSARDFTSALNTTLDSVKPEIENVGVALEAGQRLGKYQSLLPLINMIENGEGSENQVLSAMRSALDGFKYWSRFRKQGMIPPEISEPLDKLIQVIESERRKINYGSI